MTAAEHLAQYNITVQDARTFILANLTDIATIFTVSNQFGVTNDMLAEIYGGVSGESVRLFFQSQGFDANLLDDTVPVSDSFTDLIMANSWYSIDAQVGESYNISGYDAYFKSTFNADGTITEEEYIAPFGTGAWNLRGSGSGGTWEVVNNALVTRQNDLSGSVTNVMTLMSQTATMLSLNVHHTEIDSQGTAVISDDTTTVMDFTYSIMNTSPVSARTEAQMLELGLVKESISGEIQFVDSSGNAVAAPANAKVSFWSEYNDNEDIDGISLNSDGTFSTAIYRIDANTFASDEAIQFIVYADENSNSQWGSAEGSSEYEPFYYFVSTTLAAMQTESPVITLAENGSYYAGTGPTASGGVDYEVSVSSANVNAGTMLGDKVNSAFIINLHDTAENQTIIGTNVNDVLNWRGGNDTFDGLGNGGDWFNGGSDAVCLNLSLSSLNSVSLDTSVAGVVSIIDNGDIVLTLRKNQDNSVDIISGSSLLHTTNVEAFKPYITVDDSGMAYSNFVINLTGIQSDGYLFTL